MKKQKIALLCLNGQAQDKIWIAIQAARVDIVVAVDGGINWLMAAGIKPDVVIGDLDSAKPEYVDQVDSIYNPDQYSTDLEKSFVYLEQQGVTDVRLTGMEAGRVDHFLCNFFLLWKYVNRFSLQVLGEDWVGMFLSQKNSFHLAPDTRVSLVPFTECRGVTLAGFEFELKNHTMQFGDVGISNVSKQRSVEITIEDGKMLAIVYDTEMRRSST